MNVLLTLISIIAFQASASDIACKTVWVYKPFRTCSAPLNGPDTSRTGEKIDTRLVWSPWVDGGQDQKALCVTAVNSFNEQNKTFGLAAQLVSATPQKEETHDLGIRVIKYRYGCEATVTRYPFLVKASVACGTEDSWAVQVGGTARNLTGEPRCLSCDEFNNKTPAEMVECLRENIVDIIVPRAIEVRDTDRQAVRDQIRKVSSVLEIAPAKGLSVEALAPLSEYLNAKDY